MRAIWNTWYVTFVDEYGTRWAVKKEHDIGDWTFCEDPDSAYTCGSREEARKVRDEMAATTEAKGMKRGVIVLRRGSRNMSFEEYQRAQAAPKSDEPTPEQLERMKWHHTLALIHGFNVMATKAITLGEKVYYRLARDAAEVRFTELGGKIDRVDEHQPILVIPGAVPEIRFDDRDIGLMRECVARYDSAAVASPLAGDPTEGT